MYDQSRHQMLGIVVCLATGCYAGVDDSHANAIADTDADSGARAPADAGDGASGTGGPIGEAGGESGGANDDADAGDSGVLDPMGNGMGGTPLYRLSVNELRNTVSDLTVEITGEGLTPQLETAIERFPGDGGSVRFKKLDRTLGQLHVDAGVELAIELADHLTSDPSHVSTLAPGCADASSLDQTCLDALVDTWGHRIRRHPMTEAERAALFTLASDATTLEEGLSLALSGMLASPEFYYHVEYTTGPGDVETLDAHSLANRLSFMFWQTAPDAELADLAASDALLDDAVFVSQVDRLAADPRFRDTTLAFADELYHLSSLPLIVDTPMMAAVDAGLGLVDDPAAFRQATADEIHQLFDYIVWEQGGSFGDLASSGASITDSPILAALYGVEPWDGVGAPPQLPENRSGLFTRAAFLVSGIETTSPIHRGVHLFRDVLCGAVPPPDLEALPDDALELPPNDGSQTTREIVELKTGGPPCNGCHNAFNGFGYALESYDALGRFRETERVLSAEGELLGELPIDPSADLLIDGELVPVDSARELSDLLQASNRARECFASQYASYAARRTIGRADDGLVAELVELGDDSLAQMFTAIALHPSFRISNITEN